jgi:hypothetical protein
MRKIVLMFCAAYSLTFATTVTIMQSNGVGQKVLYQKTFDAKYPKDKFNLCNFTTAVKEQKFSCPSQFEFREGVQAEYAAKIDFSFLKQTSPTKVSTGYVEADIEMDSGVDYKLYKDELLMRIDN